jgi:hypothetical protein
VLTFGTAHEKHIYFVLRTIKTLQRTGKPPENLGLTVEYMHYNAGNFTSIPSFL